METELYERVWELTPEQKIVVIHDRGGKTSLPNHALVQMHNKLLTRTVRLKQSLTETLGEIQNIAREGRIRREFNIPIHIKIPRDKDGNITEEDAVEVSDWERKMYDCFSLKDKLILKQASGDGVVVIVGIALAPEKSGEIHFVEQFTNEAGFKQQRIFDMAAFGDFIIEAP